MDSKELNVAFCLENVEMQISEVDMVSSMYPKAGEFVMDDPSVIADMRNYLEGKDCPLPIGKLEYSVNIKIDETRFEVYCTLPPDYPGVKPELYVRCPSVSRELQHQLNEEVSSFVSAMERGELCVGPVLQWLQDNSHAYTSIASQMPTCPSHHMPSCRLQTKELEVDNTDFSRFWIYSHHIYNKGKRKTILELAKELDISGFCMPGKPGILCAEGLATNCEEFWNRLKHMNWKKIMCKEQELLACPADVTAVEQLRRFLSFEEISFGKSGSRAGDYHADMGEFLKYLQIHDCAYAFKHYFGIGDVK